MTPCWGIFGTDIFQLPHVFSPDDFVISSLAERPWESATINSQERPLWLIPVFYMKTTTNWSTAVPSSRNQIGCDYFQSNWVQGAGTAACWPPVRFWIRFHPVRLGLCGHSALCTVSWTVWVKKATSVCVARPHANHTITLTTSHTCELATDSSPEPVFLRCASLPSTWRVRRTFRATLRLFFTFRIKL